MRLSLVVLARCLAGVRVGKSGATDMTDQTGTHGRRRRRFQSPAVFNHGAEAYRQINITVEAFGADETLIGEGFGFLVDACGTALLDHILMPGTVQAFSAPFELFEDGAVASVVARVDGQPLEPVWSPQIEAPAASLIERGEVVMLEWLDEETLIYGIGCDGAVFTELDWRRYDLADHAVSPIEHPDAAKVTGEMIERSGAAMITHRASRTRPF